MNIRTALYLFAAALAFAAVASAESSNEESFAEATSFVQAFMSEHAKKGGESACRKVATDSIKAIKTECDALQKTVDTAAKANQACCNSGKDAVRSAEKSKGDLDGKSSTCKGEADALANAKIKFTSSLDALKGGKCKSIHGSSAYKNKKAEHKKKTKECNKLSGAASEAKKALKNAIKDAKKARKKCNKDAKKARNNAFNTAKKACNSDKNKRAFTRAQHMKCVLDGKTVKGCKVGKAPSVKKTALSKLTCAALTAEAMGEEEEESEEETKGKAAGGTRTGRKEGGKFGLAPRGDRICMLTNPKIVDMKAREEGPNMIADIHEYVKNGKSRLYQIQDVVKEIKNCIGATLVLPEFQNRALLPSETDAIKDFVNAGGSAIFADDHDDKVARVVKRAFKVTWKRGRRGTANKETKSERFAPCPLTLPALNGGTGMQMSSGANSLYVRKGGKEAMVAQLRAGKGQLWFLGFDWYAKSGREGWAKVLAAVID